MIHKTCTKCGISKPITEYHKHKRCLHGVRNDCKKCCVSRQMERQRENRDAYLEYQRSHYAANKDLYRSLQKSNPHRAEHKRIDYVKNKDAYISRATFRKAHIRRATPTWADMDRIRAIYESCPDGFHVDHEIPLRGRNVCGLHVPENLRVMTAEENLKKGNKFAEAGQ